MIRCALQYKALQVQSRTRCPSTCLTSRIRTGEVRDFPPAVPFASVKLGDDQDMSASVPSLQDLAADLEIQVEV